MTTALPVPGETPAAVLPVVEARAVLAAAVEAVPAVATADAVALRVVVELAKNVVVDGARRTVSGVTAEAIARAVVLMAGADVATSRRRPTRSVPRRSTGAATGVVLGVVLATASPTPGPGGPRVPVQAAGTAGARLGLAERLTGLEGLEIPLVATPPSPAAILPTAPRRVPVGPDVAPGLAQLPVAPAGREELEATMALVPVAFGTIPGEDHAVAHPDEVGRPTGVVRAAVVRTD